MVKGLKLFVVSVLLSLLLIPGLVYAAFPEKPVTLVVPYPAGGGNDMLARSISTAGGEYLGQPLIVQIRAGGGGAVGSQSVANAAPDGYTLLVADDGALVFLPAAQNVQYSAASFEPIAMFTQNPWIVTVPGNSPYNSLEELVEAARERPGGVSVGIAGPLSSDHVPWLLLQEQAGVRFHFVPYGGGGPKRQALLNGEIEAITDTPGAVIDLVEAGSAKLLAAVSDERVPSIPDVPTMKELGYDIQATQWIGVFAPKGTPADRLETLANAFEAMVQQPQFKALMDNIGFPVVFRRGEEFAAIVDQGVEQVKRLAEALQR